jgi:hypothetical protein
VLSERADSRRDPQRRGLPGDALSCGMSATRSPSVTQPIVWMAQFAPEQVWETSAAPRRLNRSDVDLLHRHHDFKCALGRRRIRIGDRVCQGSWRDLP